MTTTATGTAEQIRDFRLDCFPVMPDSLLAAHSDVFGENPLAARPGLYALPLGPVLSSMLGVDSVERQMVAHCSNDGNPWLLRAFAVEPEGGGLVAQEAFQTTHPDALIAGIVFGGVINSPNVVVWRHARVHGGRLEGSTELFDESAVHNLARIVDSVLRGKSYASDQTNIIHSVLEDWSRVHNHATVRTSVLTGFALVRGTSLVVDSKLSGNVIVSGNVRMADSFANGEAKINGEPTIVGSHLLDHILVEGTPRITSTEMHDESSVIQRARIVGSRLFSKSQVTGDAFVESSDLFGASAAHDNAIVIKSTLTDSTIRHHATVSNSAIEGQTIGDWVSLDDCAVGGEVALSDHLQALRANIRNRAVVGGNARITDSVVSRDAQVFGDAVVEDGSTVTDTSIVTQQARVGSTYMSGRSIARGASTTTQSELDATTVQDVVAIHASSIKNSEVSDYAKIREGNVVVDSRLTGAVQISYCNVTESILSGNFILSGVDIQGKHLNHACDPTNPKDDALFHKQTDQFLGPNFNKASCEHFTCERCNGPIYWKPAAGTHFLSDRS